jgi:hypothetical protein
MVCDGVLGGVGLGEGFELSGISPCGAVPGGVLWACTIATGSANMAEIKSVF